MPVDEQSDNSLDPMANLVASAMYTSPGSLLGKLKAIWMLAANLVTRAETEHSKRVNVLWGGPVPETSSLPDKARMLSSKAVQPESSLTQAYTELLREIAQIHSQDQLIRLKAQQPALPSNLDDAAFLAALLASANLRSEAFLNHVVPHFFALQLHCYRLYRRLEIPAGVPEESAVRLDRAAKGGKARAIGEDILKSRISDFLQSKAGETFSTGDALFDQFGDELQQILHTFQRDVIGKERHPQSHRLITYGSSLTSGGLVRKFGAWRRHDPIFKDRWEKLVPPRKKAS
ncbi:MAG: hypothetical protein E2585_00725 [Comamonas sp.]|nr:MULTISPECIES: hypothetical protein [Comamonas]MPS87221.1 hypothetical protein [Comamonas sp.]